MKKLLAILLILPLFLAACGEDKTHGYKNLPEDNIFVSINSEGIDKKLENKDTFYVYFGTPT